MPEQAESPKAEEALNPNAQDKAQTSDHSTLELESIVLGGKETTFNNHNAAETFAQLSDADPEKSLDYGDELMEQGYKAMKENDFSEAAENFSRALEIRVAHYGELAPECVHAYYKYGCALLYKAQEEADPLADVPKKEDESQQDSTKGQSVEDSVKAESSSATVSSTTEQDVSSTIQDGEVDDGQFVTSSVYCSGILSSAHFVYLQNIKRVFSCHYA